MNRTSLKHLTTLCVVNCAVALAMVAPARAEFIGNAVEVHVSSGADTGSWLLDLPLSGDLFSWSLDAPLDIYSVQHPGLLLATIDALNVMLDGDPQVQLNFAVTAGAANTNFSINSAVVSFGALNNPESFATAGITVTDNNSNGATLSGLFPGVKAYQADYNGGSVFANLVSPITAGPDSSNIGSERNPLLGTIPIAGSVSSIQASLSFNLTAFDSASGTSRFNVIVPEPSSIVLGLMGGIGLLWSIRRRK